MNFILGILLVYFLASTIYVLTLSVAGYLKKRTVLPLANSYKKIVILIPAYKEDAVIVSSVRSLLQLKYPINHFEIVVIADSLQHSTMTALASLPVRIVEVAFEKSTKAKALNKAMGELEEEYDIVLISDADNILSPTFLSKINDAFHAGHRVVQGMRVAKNINTPYAILDAYSEVVNNHLFRKGANALNISSALIGSGMAFYYQDLKDIMLKIDAIGGFDKMLQLELVADGHYIFYHDDAIVYDEKVDSPSAIKNQRKRWNASQYKYLRKYFLKGLSMLMKGNVSYFNLSILGSIFLSRIINLGMIFMLAFLITIFSLQAGIFIIVWWCLFCMYALALILPLSSMPFKVNLIKASLHLPHVFLLMIRSIFSLRGADKKFIHTSHTVTEFPNSIHANQKNE